MRLIWCLFFVAILAAPNSFADSSSVTVPPETAQPVADNSWVGTFLKKVDAGWSNIKEKVKSWWGEVPSETSPASTGTRAPSNVPETGTAVEQKNSPQQIVQQIRNADLVKVAKPAVAADPSLKHDGSGVPVFNIPLEKKSKKGKSASFSVISIPELNVGTEETIVRTEFKVEAMEEKKLNLFKINELSSPKTMTPKTFAEFRGVDVKPAPPAEKIELAKLDLDKRVSVETVQAVKYTFVAENQVSEMFVKLLTEEDLKYLRALILYVKGDKCHIVSGLFSDLLKSKNIEVQTGSEFYLGLCAHRMGLFTESIDRLLSVAKGPNAELAKEALSALLVDVPNEFEVEVARVLKSIDIQRVPEALLSKFHYVVAKGFARAENFQVAVQYADKVGIKDKEYPRAQYVLAVSEYALGKIQVSYQRQLKLYEWVKENGVDPEVRSLVSLNLARMAFQEGKFKDAQTYYLDINKDHPLWIQALTEQGWTQLMRKDESGAIGNMYSIQSPYFESVYKPETFVVRTIGYLNICQYGDAYKSLTKLESQYRPWLSHMTEYRKKNKTPDSHYATMVRYLTSKSQTMIDNLPHQVLREMGHQKEFLNLQEAINNRVDEGNQYGFLDDLIEKDKQKVKWKRGKAKERIAQLETNIQKSKVQTDLIKNIGQWKTEIKVEKDLVDFLDFVVDVYEEGRKGLKIFKVVAQGRLNRKKQEFKTAAGTVLVKGLAKMERDLNRLLDNNELLRYEVFSGSGENIRFQAGGGNAPSERRIPANVRPESKDLRWEFDGEFWEDEIGHYRSSLKNNCPDRAAQK